MLIDTSVTEVQSAATDEIRYVDDPDFHDGDEDEYIIPCSIAVEAACAKITVRGPDFGTVKDLLDHAVRAAQKLQTDVQ